MNQSSSSDPVGQSADLRTRLVCAIIEELTDDDVGVVIGVGDRELKITWTASLSDPSGTKEP